MAGRWHLPQADLVFYPKAKKKHNTYICLEDSPTKAFVLLDSRHNAEILNWVTADNTSIYLR